jgi:hypothetical protein
MEIMWRSCGDHVEIILEIMVDRRLGRRLVDGRARARQQA